MFISSFRVKNFMIHRDSSIKFFPITVLVGHNAGGKSALFDALINFSMLSRGNIAQAFGPYPYSFEARKHFGTGPTARISYEVDMSVSHKDDSCLRYEIQYRQQGATGHGSPKFIIYNERLTKLPGDELLFDNSDPDASSIKRIAPYLADDLSVFAAIRRAQMAGNYEETNSLVTYCAKQISGINKFRLDPSIMGHPGRIPDIRIDELEGSRIPRIDHKGEDLAAVLYYLSETNDPLLEEIQKKLQDVLEGFEEFQFNHIGADRIGFSVKFKDERGIVPATNLSDGTLTLLGLLVLVSTPNRPPILMIEEPENGLTPQATRAFYKAVHELAFHKDPNRRSQVILSSHSPFVICEAWNGDDRDFIYQVKPEAGKARIRKFSEVIEDEKIQLGKDTAGKRTHLSLNTASEVMAGYWS